MKHPFSNRLDKKNEVKPVTKYKISSYVDIMSETTNLTSAHYESNYNTLLNNLSKNRYEFKDINAHKKGVKYSILDIIISLASMNKFITLLNKKNIIQVKSKTIPLNITILYEKMSLLMMRINILSTLGIFDKPLSQNEYVKNIYKPRFNIDAILLSDTKDTIFSIDQTFSI